MLTRILSTVAILLSGIAIALVAWPKEKPVESTDEYPILAAMGYYQRFSHKLWLSVENENWELAEFYAHELEEVTEELVASNVMDDGMELSTYAEQMLAPAVKEMDLAIDRKDALLANQKYVALVNSCNACHTITRHAYIKIEVPDSVRPYNQDFVPAR